MMKHVLVYVKDYGIIYYQGVSCYDSIILGLIKERNLVLKLTQENSIESLYNVSTFIY